MPITRLVTLVVSCPECNSDVNLCYEQVFGTCYDCISYPKSLNQKFPDNNQMVFIQNL